MSDETGEIPGGEVVSYPTADDTPLTVEEAAREIGEARAKALNPAESAEPEKAATAEEESPVEGDAAPEEDHGETQEDNPAELPPIDPPKSWTKEARDRWGSITREAQEEFARIEQGREREFLRGQQEAAEARRAAEAELAQARELTKALSAKLPELEAAAQDFFENKYPEFKTYDDVVNMARRADALSETDPFTALQLGNRVKAWEADQNRIAQRLAAAREAKASEAKAEQVEFSKFVSDESSKLADYVSETDIKTYTPKAPLYFKELGFSDEDRSAIANGKKFSPFDARFQRMAFESMKYREMIAAPAKAAPKNLPPVQRPGVRPAPNSGVTTQIQALEKQLSSASGDRAARISAEIWRLEKKAASR